MSLHICIDESGDTGYSKKSSKYFVVCAVAVENLDVLRRLARDMHRQKYHKQKGSTLHAYAESTVIKNKLTKKLDTVILTCSVCVIKKETLVVGTDVYLHATKKIAEHFKGQDVEIIVVAKRDTRKSYNEKIRSIYDKNNLKVTFADPATDKSLQIADFYSWSTYVYFEKSISVFFKRLSNNIQIIE